MALAGYCQKVGLAEEGCVMRTQWMGPFKNIDKDLIRKIFRNTYKKPYNGRTFSQMNEKERIMRSIEDFLSRRYELRYNVVKGITEFRLNDLRYKPWKPLTDRDLKSLVVDEMKEGGESWMNDIRTYIESAHIQDYNPIHEFLAGCGQWDRKHDYIEDFARRLATNFGSWPKYFHRWFLAMVAQAVAELRNPDCIYWFTSDDEREIQQHNQQFQQESAQELVLSQIFEPTHQHTKERFWTTTAIQQELKNHLRASDIPNLTNLGLALKKLRWQRCKHKNDRGYYLRLRKS